MIIGENARVSDMDVTSPRKRSRPTCALPPLTRRSGLIPPRVLSLEQAIEFINDDELVEVTPRSIRLRKRILAGNMTQAQRTVALRPWISTCLI